MHEDWKTVHDLCQVNSMVEKVSDLTKVNDGDSHTLKLWKSYLDNTYILKMLLFVECTGDHELHVFSIRRMIPMLHAGGHIAYARSLRIHM